MSHSAELNRNFPKTVKLLQKPSSLTRGLRKPQKEELTGPFSLPGVLEKGEFGEAMDLIGDIQISSSIETPSQKTLPNLRMKLQRKQRKGEWIF